MYWRTHGKNSLTCASASLEYFGMFDLPDPITFLTLLALPASLILVAASAWWVLRR